MLLAQARLAGREAAAHAKALHAGHIPALDGIRGAAVLLVLVCHGTFTNPTGVFGQAFQAATRLTWSGVDLFFVLSGFLITGILFDSKGEHGYFRNFYARRTVRIFPLYYAFLIFSLILVPSIPALTALFGQAPSTGPTYWFYLSNFVQPFVPTHYMLHVTWSLAIEEQFYLCWPLVVFLCTRRALLRICGAMFLGSLALRLGLLLISRTVGWDNAWMGANDFLFCRVDGLAAGAWIALLIRGEGAWAIQSLVKGARVVGISAAVGLACVVIGSYATGWRGGIGQSPAYIVGGYSMLALMYASLLILVVAARRGAALNRVFSGKFLTTFGKYSYGCYLLNLPVNILLMRFVFNPDRPGASNLSLMLGQAAFYAISFAATLATAWVSWNVMEKHFLKLKKYFPMSRPTATQPPVDPPAQLRRAA
jgi:peptidoglycan/LPS O-acetylase OafA/YrhL